ncbi:MAG: DUF732 domain-containing protein [Mycobacterium sp.]|uniref:DUF732 domain-containing protein n=1 Tax=Mycobacterium sp. TaxID=1785 RepID=UPI003C3A295E
MLATLVFGIAAISAVFVLSRNPDLLRPKADTTVSQAASGAPIDPPPDTTDRNGMFLWRLSSEGLQLARSNDAAINDARRVCTRFASGESEPEIVQDMLQGSPGMSLSIASGFADTAISVYCPDGVVKNS